MFICILIATHACLVPKQDSRGCHPLKLALEAAGSCRVAASSEPWSSGGVARALNLRASLQSLKYMFLCHFLYIVDAQVLHHLHSSCGPGDLTQFSGLGHASFIHLAISPAICLF